MTQNGWALVLSFGYVGLIVAIGETAARLGVSKGVARKIIHVGVGLWVFGTLRLFTSPLMAIIPPLAAAAGNFVIHRYRLLKAVEAEPENLGTVYFPLAFALVLFAGWGRPDAIVGGVMAMTIGDALASIVGHRFGRQTYVTLGGYRKSLEGSLAMLGGTWVVLLVMLPTYGAAYPRLAMATLAAVVAMCVEALGALGLDNLTVAPVVAAVIYFVPGGHATMLGAGALLATGIGLFAWWRGSLSPSGVLGAIVTGTLIFGFADWTGGLALVGFFVTSSVLSKLFRRAKRTVEADYAKTGTRDLGQVLANGGVAAVGAILFAVTRNGAYVGALLGALAAANADTWATELGVLSRSAPRLITNPRRVVARGTSGAVSGVGTLAAAAGAAFIGVVGALANSHGWSLLPWVMVAGFVGALLDSLLGATLQSISWCDTCGKETERRLHSCGQATRAYRGLPWLGNDTVNLIATVAGAAIGFWGAS